MRAASSGTAALRLSRTRYCVVQEQIPALGNVQAAVLHIAVCCCLKPYRFKLGLHLADRNERQHEAYHY